MSRVIKFRSFSIAMIFGVMILSPLAPTAAASSEEYEDPIAFLPGWNESMNVLTIPYYNYQMISGSNDSDVSGFDSVGNFYAAVVDDNVVIGDYTSGQRGIHIVKFDPNGTLSWGKVVSSSNYCYSSSDASCNVISLHIVDEDEFYLLVSIRYASLTFSGSVSTNSGTYQLVMAHHNSSGWSWAEAIGTSGYAHQYVVDSHVDSSNDLVVLLRGSISGSYQEYSLIGYTSSGGKWNRLLETYYGSPTYANSPIMMDVEGTTTHIFALTKTNLRYDSQSTYCSNGAELGYCYAWISIDNNGARTSQTSVDYPSVYFGKFEVHQSKAYLYGYSEDVLNNGNDYYTNFTGTMTSNNNSGWASVLCSISSNGNWNYVKYISIPDDEWSALSQPIYEDDGSAYFFTHQYSSYPTTNYYDGNDISNYSALGYQQEFSVVRIDSSGNYQWHTGLGGSYDLEPNDFEYSAYVSNSGYFVMSMLSNGVIQAPGGVSTTACGYDTSSTHCMLAWFHKSNGTMFDSEYGEDATLQWAKTSSPEGGLLTFEIRNDSWHFRYFMPDNDGDNVGTVDNCPEIYNPSQADHDLDLDGDACDDDDDNDGIEDLFDYCQRGELNWISDSLTDHDGDGCKDSTEEDLDDDNDGRSDLNDLCPFGIIGAGNDFDGDGCKDLEDNDDDNDGVADGSDLCDKGEIDWSSGTVTDHDGDGCNDASEDSDDDNDGVSDLADSCPKGATDWPSNLNTDFDEDGCKDGFEDEDDDNDGVINPSDNCPNSSGTVDENGCSASQNIDGSGNNGGSSSQTVVYYVCPQGGLVVTELSDCPVTDNNNTDNQQEPVTQFYYVCPGGTEIVTDMADCPEGLPSTSQNITYVIDPDSNYSDDFSVCPGGTVLVKDPSDCSSQESDDSTSNGEKNSNQESGSTDTIVLVFAGGAFLLAMAAVLLVLVRKPVSADTNFARLESADTLFKESPSSVPMNTLKKPPNDIIGSTKDGYEWVEWPPGTDSHWYRAENSSDDWSQYGN